VQDGDDAGSSAAPLAIGGEGELRGGSLSDEDAVEELGSSGRENDREDAILTVGMTVVILTP
jgi:hypothetical protein